LKNNEKKCMKMLKVMLSDMSAADPLYAPTDFWSIGVSRIVDEINQKGLSGFRGHQSAVSTYYLKEVFGNKAVLAVCRISGKHSMPVTSLSQFSGWRELRWHSHKKVKTEVFQGDMPYALSLHKHPPEAVD
jgi:hypothetical protein